MYYINTYYTSSSLIRAIARADESDGGAEATADDGAADESSVSNGESP